MNKEIIKDIHKYISFLEQCGYAVSFSFIKNHFSPFTHELMQYNFHPHAVCNYLKQNPQTAGRCVLNKRKLEKKDIRKPYYGCCFAGVEEFLFPLLCEDEIILCIHVSGYRGKLDRSRSAMEEISALCTDRFHTLYNELSDEIPNMEYVLSFIKPLQYMLLNLYQNCCSERIEDTSQAGILYVKALQFIHENYSHHVNCDVLASEMGYSASYMRYIFKREGKTSVQSKINEIRLDNAKRLLRGSTMSVTEIAFSVGFADSNYFSSLFKKQNKILPRIYRKMIDLGTV